MNIEITKKWINEDIKRERGTLSVLVASTINLKKWVKKNNIKFISDICNREYSKKDIEPYVYFLSRIIDEKHIYKLLPNMFRNMKNIFEKRRELPFDEKLKRYKNIADMFNYDYSDIRYKDINEFIQEVEVIAENINRYKDYGNDEKIERLSDDLEKLSRSLAWREDDFSTYHSGMALSDIIRYLYHPKCLYTKYRLILSYFKAMNAEYEKPLKNYHLIMEFCIEYIRRYVSDGFISGDKLKISMKGNFPVII